jgi:hypothetical protein
VTAFLTRLAVTDQVSASTQNQAFSALLFLDAQVIERPLAPMQVERAQRPRKLPVVLTREEVKPLRAQVEGVDWLMGGGAGVGAYFRQSGTVGHGVWR